MTNLLLLGFLPSGSEWLIILLVILLLFGGNLLHFRHSSLFPSEHTFVILSLLYRNPLQ